MFSLGNGLQFKFLIDLKIMMFSIFIVTTFSGSEKSDLVQKSALKNPVDSTQCTVETLQVQREIPFRISIR